VGRRLILDTNVLIAYERDTIVTRDFKARFAGLPGILAIDA
jgi:hypothetical protein